MQDIITLTDKDAAHYAIKSKLEEAAGRVKEGGKLWFVFIGHGAPSADGTDGLLVGAKADTTAEGIYQNSLSRAQVLEIVQGAGAPSVLVLDVCFSGVYGEGNKSIAKGLQPMVPVHVGNVYGKILVLSAGKADQFAGPLPGDARPAFSYLLVRGLSGEGDSDFDGQVSAREGMAFASREMGRVALGRKQEPQLDPGANGDWLLTPQTDPSVGCSQGLTRSADTDGQCCWPGQSWSRSKDQCVGEPDRCPPGLARLANACGPCLSGQTLRGDVCEADAACPAGTTEHGGVCVSDTSTPRRDDPPKKSSARAIWGWVTVGTGAALVGAGIGTFAYASSLASELEGTGLTQVEAADKDSQISTLNAVTITGFAVGGAALVTGVILLLTGGDESSPVVNVSSDGQGFLFGLGGRF